MIEEVTDDGENFPMWYPSDNWIANQIRSRRGWGDSRPVPASLIAAWRAAMRSEALRQRRWRRRNPDAKIPMPVRRRERTETVDAFEIAREVLTHPYMLAMLSAMIFMPRLMTAAMAETGTLFRKPPRWRLVPILAYIREKIPGDRGILIRHSNQTPVSPMHVAAVNGMTRSAAILWNERLTVLAATQQHDAVDAALAELAELGVLAIEAANPLRITGPEPGPPRGLLPDPEPEPEPPVLAGVPGGEGATAPAPGGR
ncbi:hypothetical protein [Acidisoma cladoniae]|jgi:hypothetical protein|uniref:hypothetical protein n=1 Tax=Acidisoma cladoniae TaxID=3040935 RepID=UPI00254A8CBF|nr:hypothetical protein [Acidisoma sp. PAMC 29798]